jgi:hypothetical protein
VSSESTELFLKRQARVAGLLYLVVTAFFAELFVRSKLIVDSNAAATARNIMGSQTLYRLGGAAELINLLCDVALAVIIYVLFMSFDRTLALIGVLFLITGACYEINSFGHLVLPQVHVPFYFLLAGLISESALMIWLLIRGINFTRWQEANIVSR